MSMSDIWYETVSPGERLTRGDIIFDCPLVSWSSTPIQVTGSGSEVEALETGNLCKPCSWKISAWAPKNITQGLDILHDMKSLKTIAIPARRSNRHPW